MHPIRELTAALGRARANTDSLFRLVRPAALYERPIPERHRIIFYTGHLEAFDWNLCRDVLGLETPQPEFDRLFAFGIDPEAGKAPSDQPQDWPSAGEVENYARRARRAVDEAISKLPDWILHIAIEHRLMHAETFAYMLHNLPLEHKLAPAPGGAPASGGAARFVGCSAMIDIPEGSATLGRARGEGFGWDNEFQAHAVQAPAFAIGKYKVTNGEYLGFVHAGAEPPHFWVRRGDRWFYRAMFGEAPLPFDWPVYVTHAEAALYARWAGKSLPSEAQFHRAAFGSCDGEERTYPWGSDAPSAIRGNFNFERWDPVPVDATPAGNSAFGVSQLVGNGWEWTSTVFEPFPGFQPMPFYAGYSANFFDGAHYVLKGGSARTAAPLLRRSFRNWFRPDYPHVYAGFRLVDN